MWVQIPCLPLTRLDGETDIMPRFYRGVPGSNPGRAADRHGVCGVAVAASLAVNQEVRVQLPSDTLAALRATGSVHACAPGRAGSLQNCSTGFDSSRSCFCPDGVAECIGPSEGPGPGSNPGRDTGLRVCRIARQFSTLQDEVRLLGGLLRQLRPRSVLDGHATLRRLRSRFDSWRGRL